MGEGGEGGVGREGGEGEGATKSANGSRHKGFQRLFKGMET